MEAKGHVALEQPSSALRGGAGWQWRTAPASASACSTRLSRWPPPTIAGGIRPSPLNVFRHRSRSLSVPLYLVKTPLVKLDCREVFVAVHIALSFISPLVHGCPCCTSSDGFAAFCFSLFLFLFLAFPLLSTMPGANLERNGPSTDELLSLLHHFFFFLSLRVLSACGVAPGVLSSA